MKKFTDKINESADMSYTDFFGKKVSHGEAFRQSVRDGIVNIVQDENGIHEKDFTRIDEAIEQVKGQMTPEMYAEANEMYLAGKRMRYITEMIYDKYFKEK